MTVATNRKGLPSGDVQSYWKSIATNSLRLSPSQLLWTFVPYGLVGANGTTQVTASGGASGSGTKRFRLANGNTAGGLVAQFLSNSTGATAIQAGTGTGFLWWMGGRFQLSSATIDAGHALGLISAATVTAGGAAAPSLVVGAYGGSSTTKFVVRGTAGSFIDSGVAADTAMHTHIAWYDGASAWYQVDNNAPVAGTARPGADAYVGCMSYGSAINTPNQVSIVWQGFGTNQL